MEETNNKFEALRKQVQYKTRLAWTQQNNDRIMSFADEYKKSLNAGKTERKIGRAHV